VSPQPPGGRRRALQVQATAPGAAKAVPRGSHSYRQATPCVRLSPQKHAIRQSPERGQTDQVHAFYRDSLSLNLSGVTANLSALSSQGYGVIANVSRWQHGAVRLHRARVRPREILPPLVQLHTCARQVTPRKDCARLTWPRRAHPEARRSGLFFSRRCIGLLPRPPRPPRPRPPRPPPRRRSPPPTCVVLLLQSSHSRGCSLRP